MNTHSNELKFPAGEPPSSAPAVGPAGKALVFQLKNILAPVDFSRASGKALQYAIPFARRFGAELTLLHVIPPAVVLQTSDLGPQGVTEATAAARESLDELRQSIGRDIPTRCIVRAGSPHVEIVDAARELNIHLIILSTHGHTGLSHILMGRTAEKVVRRAGCPVLVVREHEHEFITVEEAV